MAGTETIIAADWLARQIPGTRAEDVRSAVAQLITTGALRPGSQLPTIRQLADQLDTKVSAVTDAWTMLRRDGLVETRRRGGTRVLGPADGAPPAPPLPPETLPAQGSRTAPLARTPLARTPLATRISPAGQGGFPGWAATELANAWPDVDLLPDTRPAFAASVDHNRPFGQFPTVTAALAAALSQTWPFDAPSFTALTSGKTALTLAVEAALEIAHRPASARPADRQVVAVESPGLVRSAAALQALAHGRGVHLVALESDAEGPTVGSVRAALADGASVITLQPVRRIPTGSSLTEQRRDALAGLITAHPTPVTVVEEDPVGLLFSGSSLGQVLPRQTVRLAQYWRAFGPDVDVVAVGGCTAVVERVRAAQQAAGLRVGALVQEVLARLLGDPHARALAAAAGERYTARNTAFLEALAAHGITSESYGGLFAWIPVRDVAGALAALSAGGIRLLGGASSFTVPAPPAVPSAGRSTGPAAGPAPSYVRVATTRLPDDPFHVRDLAAAIASAAQGATLVDTE